MSKSTLLSNFGDNLNVAVIGASGGIGRAFIDHLTAQNNVQSIYALSRRSIEKTHPKIMPCTMDMTDEESIAAAKEKIGNTQLDIIIVATGFLHDDTQMPEKSLRDLNLDNCLKTFTLNTIGPALIMKHFLPLIPKDRHSTFAALSARVGSISDNHLGGWYAYRASKSALNMMLKNAAIETTRRYKQSCVIGLHPGTVDTVLSKPFQGNVAPEKLFTPEKSAQSLLSVINNTTPDQSGLTFAWDGSVIPY